VKQGISPAVAAIVIIVVVLLIGAVAYFTVFKSAGGGDDVSEGAPVEDPAAMERGMMGLDDTTGPVGDATTR